MSSNVYFFYNQRCKTSFKIKFATSKYVYIVLYDLSTVYLYVIMLLFNSMSVIKIFKNYCTRYNNNQLILFYFIYLYLLLLIIIIII